MALLRAKVRLLLLALFLGASSLTASYFLLAEQRRSFSFGLTQRDTRDSQRLDSINQDHADFESYIRKILTDSIFPSTMVNSLDAETSAGSDLTSTRLIQTSSTDIFQRSATGEEKISANFDLQGIKLRELLRRNQPKQPSGTKPTPFNLQHDSLSKFSTSIQKRTRQNTDSATNTNHTINRKSGIKFVATTKTSLERLILRPTASVYGDSKNCPENYWRSGLIELFRAWIAMSQKHNIEYVLAFGSLLGATRNGDVIPWDSDIDVLVDKELFPVLEELSTERNFDSADGVIRFVVQPEFRQEVSETRRRFTCAGKETPNMVDQCSFQEPLGRLIKGNLHIDIFHFYHTPNKRIKEPSEGRMKTYEKSDFFPLKPCMFLGMKTFCPNKPLKVSQTYFGMDNLQPPYKCKNGQWLNDRGRSPW